MPSDVVSADTQHAPPAARNPSTANYKQFPCPGWGEEREKRRGGKAVVTLKQTHKCSVYISRIVGPCHGNTVLAGCIFQSEMDRGDRGDSQMSDKCATNTRLSPLSHSSHTTTTQPHHLTGSPQHRLLFGLLKSTFQKLETCTEEMPDSPELGCWPFPQETWSVSSQGALDRRVHTHSSPAAQSYNNWPVRWTKQDEEGCWKWPENRKIVVGHNRLSGQSQKIWNLFLQHFIFCFTDIISLNRPI